VVRNDHAALVAGPLAVERDGSDRRALAQTAGGGERERPAPSERERAAPPGATPLPAVVRDRERVPGGYWPTGFTGIAGMGSFE